MSILTKATSGALIRPQILTIYGPNGVGKTTLSSKFPMPVMFDLEEGSGAITDKNFVRIGKAQFPTFEEYTAGLLDLLKDAGDRKTLVTDSVEALESLIHKSLIKSHNVTSIEDIAYGKGMVMAREKMEETMHLFQRLRDEKGLNVILVGHSIQKAFTDPKANVSYDRYIMRANDKFAAVIRDLSDGVFFLNHRTLTETNKNNPAKAKAFSTGESTLHTVWSHAFDAKSRYQLPAELSYSLLKISEVVSTLLARSDKDLIMEISSLRARVSDKEIGAKIDKAVTDAADDVQKLRAIKVRLEELTQMQA